MWWSGKKYVGKLKNSFENCLNFTKRQYLEFLFTYVYVINDTMY